MAKKGNLFALRYNNQPLFLFGRGNKCPFHFGLQFKDRLQGMVEFVQNLKGKTENCLSGLHI